MRYDYVYANMEDFEFGWLSPDAKAIIQVNDPKRRDYFEPTVHNALAMGILCNMLNMDWYEIMDKEEEVREKWAKSGRRHSYWFEVLESRGWIRLHERSTGPVFIDSGKMNSKQRNYITDWAHIRGKSFQKVLDLTYYF